MHRYVVVWLKKWGTPTELGFTLGQKIEFLLGFPVQYRGYIIEAHLGERTILVDLVEAGAEIPEIPPQVTERVKYDVNGFKSRYPNGQGYYGKTFISVSTLDGQQQVLIHGSTTAAVREALERFEKGELPPNWARCLPQRSSKVVRVRKRSCREEKELYDLETSWWGGHY